MLTVGITVEHLAELYSDPYIASRIAHDDRQPLPVFHELAFYLSAWVDGKFAGAFLVIKYTDHDWELHSLLKREFLKYSRSFGRECIAYCFGRGVNRLTVWIIDGLKTVENFCLKLGFSKDGVRRSACLKDGVFRDVHMYGMTRIDWETK